MASEYNTDASLSGHPIIVIASSRRWFQSSIEKLIAATLPGHRCHCVSGIEQLPALLPSQWARSESGDISHSESPIVTTETDTGPAQLVFCFVDSKDDAIPSLFEKAEKLMAELERQGSGISGNHAAATSGTTRTRTQLRVVVMMDQQDDAIIDELLQGPVFAVIRKACSPEDLISSVGHVLAGKRVRPTPLEARADSFPPAAEDGSSIDWHSHLDARQQQLLQAVSSGENYRELAHRFGLTEKALIEEVRQLNDLMRGKSSAKIDLDTSGPHIFDAPRYKM